MHPLLLTALMIIGAAGMIGFVWFAREQATMNTWLHDSPEKDAAETEARDSDVTGKDL